MTVLASTTLFGRACRLVIGFPTDPSVTVQAQFNDTNTQGVDVSGHDIEFIIEKSLKPTEPNTCVIRVYNLSASDRQNLSGAASLTVRLDAGYQQQTSQLYFAGARSAWSTKDSQGNYITHIESTDTIARPTGLKKTKKIPAGSNSGSIYRTMGAKVPLAQAFQSIAAALGIGVGNLNQSLANMTAPITAVNGAALLGNGARRMTDLCRSAGLEWSVQDGNLQLLNVGQVLSTSQAILLTDTSGLVESPNVDSQGALEIKSLLIPGLAPGVLVNVQSEFVQGGYRIEKIRYSGHTRGQEWYATMAAARY